MHSGDISSAKGYLYTSDRRVVGTITNNYSISLMPGNYYFETTNNYKSIYSIRAIVTDVVETVHQIDSLKSYTQITGSAQLQPQYVGKIKYLGEFIVYKFTLTETTDVAFYQNNTFEFYDSMNNRIDILNLSDRFVYRLKAGDYFVRVTYPSYYNESHFPVDYTLVLFKFTGGGADTSVYPFIEEIPLGFQGMTSTIDYSGDYDGYNFTLTETTRISIMSSYSAKLLFNNRIIDYSVDHEEYTLEPGTYTIMCNTYQPTWTVRVMIKTWD